MRSNYISVFFYCVVDILEVTKSDSISEREVGEVRWDPTKRSACYRDKEKRLKCMIFNQNLC
jgi:hypothetical protein